MPSIHKTAHFITSRDKLKTYRNCIASLFVQQMFIFSSKHIVLCAKFKHFEDDSLKQETKGRLIRNATKAISFCSRTLLDLKANMEKENKRLFLLLRSQPSFTFLVAQVQRLIVSYFSIWPN